MPIIISDYRGTCVRICVFLGAYGGDKRSYCKFIIRVLDDLFFSEPDPITIICQNNEPDAIMISFFSTLQKMSHDQIMIQIRTFPDHFQNSDYQCCQWFNLISARILPKVQKTAPPNFPKKYKKKLTTKLFLLQFYDYILIF